MLKKTWAGARDVEITLAGDVLYKESRGHLSHGEY